MAFSDYVTGEEWDAMAYAFAIGQIADDFGSAMLLVRDALLQKGYTFPGLTSDGRKKCQISSNNGKKLVQLWGIADEGIDLIEVFDSGRNFLKQHAPELVCESDEDWNEAMTDHRSEEEDHGPEESLS